MVLRVNVTHRGQKQSVGSCGVQSKSIIHPQPHSHPFRNSKDDVFAAMFEAS